MGVAGIFSKHVGLTCSLNDLSQADQIILRVCARHFGKHMITRFQGLAGVFDLNFPITGYDYGVQIELQQIIVFGQYLRFCPCLLHHLFGLVTVVWKPIASPNHFGLVEGQEAAQVREAAAETK